MDLTQQRSCLVILILTLRKLFISRYQANVICRRFDVKMTLKTLFLRQNDKWRSSLSVYHNFMLKNKLWNVLITSYQIAKRFCTRRLRFFSSLLGW